MFFIAAGAADRFATPSFSDAAVRVTTYAVGFVHALITPGTPTLLAWDVKDFRFLLAVDAELFPASGFALVSNAGRKLAAENTALAHHLVATIAT